MQLVTNTASQLLYLTLKEQTPSNTAGYFLEFENVASNEKFTCTGNDQESNDRFTSFEFGSHQDVPASGDLLIAKKGYYILRVYYILSGDTVPVASRLIETKLVHFIDATPASPVTIVNDSNNEQVIYYES